MMWLPLTVSIFIAGLFLIQKQHYNFILEEKKQSEVKFTDEKLKELEELKKRVNTLTVSAGFKL